ncbi:MAG: penicillin-binding protein [Eggerthellaceae bacterium]|jgi:penicillin-binding protein 1A|nr:penicillin-binding protein [Eggerthellaceae bacterium]MDR2715389.1 penicillin-binding protein [Coriobacteriaceae bacterium]
MKRRRKIRQKRTHGFSWSLFVAVLAAVVIAYGAVQGVFGIINSWLEDLPSVENSDAFNYARKTYVYANDKTTLLAEFFLENREPVSIEQVSNYVLRGTVATEDERFYEHNGVDPQGIARALYVNLQGGELEGASTITQQFVRATLLSNEANEISLKRKIREAQLAINLEKIHEKDEILMIYLNTINYGDGCYGIEAAARNYFQKSALDLSLVEAATLVGIPQSPNYLNPKTNPDACFDRRNHVLSRMLANKIITQEEHDAAVAEPLALNPAPAEAPNGIYAFPHFTSYVREQLIEQFTMAEVFRGGLTIYTTIDPTLQYKAEQATAEQYALMDDDLDVSLTAVDPSTGYILAMVGGRNFYDEADGQFNLATQAARHAGSSFKVFTLVTAIEQGISPSTKIDCSSPVDINGWRVENYGGGSYGIRTIQGATAISSNTGYARLVQEVDSVEVYQTARRMGIVSVDTGTVNLSADEAVLGVGDAITLGAYGVNTLEMANAYATLATGGIKRNAVAITTVIDHNDDIIYHHEDAPEQILTPEVSYAATRVLQTVFTEGTASGSGLWSGQPCAGKTGTSEDWRDSWLCGYTPQLSCAVWIGAPQVERTMPESLTASGVWHNFMTMALEDREIVNFDTAVDPPYNNPFNEKQKGLFDTGTDNAPKVDGMTLEEAIAALEGFEYEMVEEYSNTVPAGKVISQKVSDDTVIIIVSKGKDPSKAEPTPKPDAKPDTKPDPEQDPDPDSPDP